MNKKTLRITLALFLIFLIGFIIFRVYLSPDYASLYKNFCINDLSEFIESNNLDIESDKISEHYIVDLKNTGKPKLLLIYGDHNPQNIVISYKYGSFVLDESIDLSTNIGSGGSEYKMILSKEGKTYYYCYKSERLAYGEDSRWSVMFQIYTYEKEQKVIVDELISENGEDYFLNGEKVPEEFDENTLLENYEIVFDSRDFVL